MNKQYAKVMYGLMDRLEAFTLRRPGCCSRVPSRVMTCADIHLG